jgi:hypothetical protein
MNSAKGELIGMQLGRQWEAAAIASNVDGALSHTWFVVSAVAWCHASGRVVPRVECVAVYRHHRGEQTSRERCSGRFNCLHVPQAELLAASGLPLGSFGLVRPWWSFSAGSEFICNNLDSEC